MRYDSAEILFQSFPREASVSGSEMDRQGGSGRRRRHRNKSKSSVICVAWNGSAVTKKGFSHSLEGHIRLTTSGLWDKTN